MKMLVTKNLPLVGAAVVRSVPWEDSRGRFARFFCQNELRALNGGRPIQQVNFSLTLRQGSVRGLHFQRSPHSENKMIRCLQGRVFDVIVDLRRESPTYGKWCCAELSAAARNMVFVPRGCAHGFQTLEPDCEMLYLHTEFYSPPDEGGVRYDSPNLGIHWPIPVTAVSDRDMCLPLFDESFEGLTP